jgi:predicted phage-related endonuclease
MPIERHPTKPGELHPLRERDITASVYAALHGAHPYKTIGGLYHQKKYGLELAPENTTAMERGRKLEQVVADYAAEQRPNLIFSKADEYLRDPALRLGATPDRYIRDERGRRGVAQLKTASKFVFDKQWSDSPPVWICLQNAVELMLADADFGLIAVLVLDNWNFECRLYDVPRHPGAEKRIVETVKKFWADVEAGVQPKIDYERDGDLIALMFPQETAGKIVDLRDDNRMPELLAERARLLKIVKDAEAEREAIDNEIKLKIGDAETALAQGWRVMFKQQTRKEHLVRAATFRVLRAKQDQEVVA